MDDVTQKTLTSMAKEIATLKELLTNLVKVVKRQQQVISELESSVADQLVPEAVLMAHERQQQHEGEYKRVLASPKCVALAMYYYYTEQFPKRRILESGLISQGQLYKVLAWSLQYLEDYCRLAGVLDIYKHGVDADTLKTLAKRPEALVRKFGGRHHGELSN